MSAETPEQKELPMDGNERKKTYLPQAEAYVRIKNILELFPPEERFGLVSDAIRDVCSKGALGEADLLMILDGLLQNFSPEEQEQVVERIIYELQPGKLSQSEKNKDQKSEPNAATTPDEHPEVVRAMNIYKFQLEQWYQRAKENVEASFDQEAPEVVRTYFRKRLKQEYQDGLKEIEFKMCNLKLKIASSNRQLLYEKAAILEQMRLYEKANSIYRILLLDKSNNSILWSHIAKNLEKLGNSREALIAHNESVRLDPQNTEYLIRQGNLYYRMKLYEEACTAYEKALKQDPSQATIWYRLGMCFKMIHMNEKALLACKRAAKLDPSDINVQILSSKILENLGLYEQALEGYKQILTLQPHNSHALCKIGDTLIQLDRKEEALQTYECASDLHNNMHVRLRKAALLEELSRYEEALKIYEELLTLFPENSELYFHKGCLLRKLEDHENAQQAYRRGSELGQIPWFAWNSIGNVLKIQKRYNEAIESYNQALRICPDNTVVIANKIETLIMLGQHNEAWIMLRDLVGHDTGENLRWCDIGQWYGIIFISQLKEGKSAEAAQLWKEGIQLAKRRGQKGWTEVVFQHIVEEVSPENISFVVELIKQSKLVQNMRAFVKAQGRSFEQLSPNQQQFICLLQAKQSNS